MEIAELKREFDELKDDAEKQELRVRYHETRAYYIAMAYIIWESIVYILFFLEAVTMMYRSQNHLDIIFHTLDQISQLIIILNSLPGDSVPRVGFDFSFRVHALDQYRPYTILYRKLYFASILCALLALTAFQLCITFNYSLCN